VKTVVEVGEGGRLHLDEAGGGHRSCEDNKESHRGGNRSMLDPENISSEQTLQLTILKAMPIKQPRKCNFSVAVHGLYTVVHDGSTFWAFQLAVTYWPI